MDGERIRRVKDRLFLYDKISDLKESFKGHIFTENYGDGTFDHKYRHYEALRCYLLLTCFDILGQESEFVDFDKFLKAKEFKAERVELLRKFSTEPDIELPIQKMHEYYLKTYGFKKRYLYFIDNILDKTQRERLYSSIKIQKINKTQKTGLRVENVGSTKKKNDFLFRLRNEFTHEGKSWATGSHGIFDDLPSIWDKGEIKWAFQTQYLEKFPTYQMQYLTLRWPNELRKILQVTIERLRTQRS
jgi:hypothetical protein